MREVDFNFYTKPTLRMFRFWTDCFSSATCASILVWKVKARWHEANYVVLLPYDRWHMHLIFVSMSMGILVCIHAWLYDPSTVHTRMKWDDWWKKCCAWLRVWDTYDFSPSHHNKLSTHISILSLADPHNISLTLKLFCEYPHLIESNTCCCNFHSSIEFLVLAGTSKHALTLQ